MGEEIEIIVVGDEILRGETPEVNASFIARELGTVGREPWRVSILPDDLDVLAGELGKAAVRSGVVIVSGGLGPTVDDVTKGAVIRAFGLAVEVRDEIAQAIAARFRSLGRDMPSAYRDQARVPKGATVLPNSIGSAVGLRIRVENCDLFLVPGVPAEMRQMLRGSVLPALGVAPRPGRRRFRTFGLTESEVEKRIGKALGVLPRGLSVISSPLGVDFYLPAEALGTMNTARLEDELSSWLYERGDRGLADIVLELLGDAAKTLAVAESVTGGCLTDRLVSVPGASDAFIEGFVTYRNEAKVARLGIDRRLIGRSGAVSRSVCVAMAKGAREVSGADFALSTTGIAGPGGGTPGKPVGLCYVGLASEAGCYCNELLLPGDREQVRLRAAGWALDMLRLALLGVSERLGPFRFIEEV